ncbi:MAG: orotidine-5'-phosphate decarboxylase, partial [Sphingobacteriia bacterium]|nr:orotidine-5'-phosphate decarboxylase [Sphingobacteriia bacterium]
VGQIPQDVFVIADAKRGDIGNSSSKYAKAILNMDRVTAITVSPYMGFDSVNPFLHFSNKWTFVLALTSNNGADDFQLQRLSSGKYLFEEVIIKSLKWAEVSPGILGFVVGATHPEHMELVRKHAPNTYILCPGVGTQGGDLQAVIKHFAPRVLINIGRHLLYTENQEDPFKAAQKKAAIIQTEMAKWF